MPQGDDSERDELGRFKPGYRGGPGGYKTVARKQAEYRRRMWACVTIEEMDATIKAILGKAKKGDVAAAKLIWSYVQGDAASELILRTESSALADKLTTSDKLRMAAEQRAKLDEWEELLRSQQEAEAANIQ